MTAIKSILVAEDNDDDFEFMEHAFKKYNIQNYIHRCLNGFEVMDYLHQRGRFVDVKENLRPQIILLDINMPKKDGYDVIKELKVHPEYCRIPIIVLTTSDDELDIKKCYELGANSYIVKPITLQAYLEATRLIKDYWLNLTVLPKE